MSKRIDKINQLLLRELAKLIFEKFAGQFITVVEVDTAPDLKNAKVWVSIFGENEDGILKELEKKAPVFQSYLGKKLFIKNIPKLSFCLDKSSRRIAKIEEILEKS